MGAVREYGAKLGKEAAIDSFKRFGTAAVGDFTNYVGGLPVRNFSAGQLTPDKDSFRLGGAHIRERNLARGGLTEHACMPGCMIECSNVYADDQGKEIVSPLEYETLGLMGSNCGLEDPDDVARLNAVVAVGQGEMLDTVEGLIRALDVPMARANARVIRTMAIEGTADLDAIAETIQDAMRSPSLPWWQDSERQ